MLSARERRLEAELEEQRLECQRLQHEKITLVARTEVLENKSKRFQSSLSEAQQKQLECEQEMLKLKQQNAQTHVQAQEQIDSLRDQFDLEIHTLKSVLEDTERRAEEARKLERTRTAEVQELLDLLELEKKKNGAEVPGGAKKKRTRRGADTAEDEEDALKRRIRQLEAENEALQTGVAMTTRTEELLNQLREVERREKRLQDEVATLKKERRALLESVDKLETTQVQLKRANEELDRLLKVEASVKSVMEECDRWRGLLRDAPTPEKAQQRFAEWQRENSALTESNRQAKNEKEALKEKLHDVEEKIKQLEETVEACHQAEAAAKAQVLEMESRLRTVEGERDGAHKALKLVPVVTSSATNTDSGEWNALQERVRYLTESLEKARQEQKEAVQTAERVEKENERLVRMVGQGAFDPSTTRVLHMKPTMRADYKPPQEKPLAVVAGSSSSAASIATPAVGTDADHDKRRERLKEMFQKQIRLYKEAVFLLFGWKLEMTPDEKPQLRLRSMYAASPDDYLLFRMNPSESTLELLETEYGKQLDQMALMYLVEYDSPPMFHASLVSALFETQTLPGRRRGGGGLMYE